MMRSLGDSMGPDRAVAIADITAVTVMHDKHARFVICYMLCYKLCYMVYSCVYAYTMI